MSFFAPAEEAAVYTYKPASRHLSFVATQTSAVLALVVGWLIAGNNFTVPVTDVLALVAIAAGLVALRVWLVARTRLHVGPGGFRYSSWLRTVNMPWSEVGTVWRVPLPWHGRIRVPLDGGLVSVRLHMFDQDWRHGELGQDIHRLAPHVM